MLSTIAAKWAPCPEDAFALLRYGVEKSKVSSLHLQRTLPFGQNVVYGVKYNGPLKISVKNSHSLDEFLGNGDVKTEWEACSRSQAPAETDGPADGCQ